MENREFRIAPAGGLELRAKANGGAVLEGYAAVFNRLSGNLGGFVEEVAPGAFTKTIKEQDVRGLFNHKREALLGRTRSGTLRLAEDSLGLHYEIDMPDTALARDVKVLAERGDLTGSSFAFRVMGPEGDEWGLTDDDFPKRTLKEVRLFDVGPVTFPAYTATEEADTAVALRCLAARLGVEESAVRSATDLAQIIKTPDGDSRSEPEQSSTRTSESQLPDDALAQIHAAEQRGRKHRLRFLGAERNSLQS